MGNENKLDLLNSYYYTPRIKLRKNNTPVRPVVDAINCSTYNLSKFLNKALRGKHNTL